MAGGRIRENGGYEMGDGDTKSTGQGSAGTGLSMGTDTMSGMPVPGAGVPQQAQEEDVVILEAGHEKAQKFIRVMSNQNASDVLALLKDGGGLRLSDIAERLGMSLNATKYHIENMMDAGLLEISNTRYSVKGRKVKIYRMKNQIFIVAPGMTEKRQIISAVMKYGSFLGIYVLIALGIVLLIPQPELAGTIPLSGSILPAGTKAVADQGFVAALLIAAVITLLLLVGYEVREYFRNRQAAGN
jgi:DNA-binding transcriptional ArsR family regulator